LKVNTPKTQNKNGTGRIRRWHCGDCGASFKVTSGTIFQGTKIPLQKWFLAIVLMVNAKKSLSSCQLAHDLGMQQRAAWCILMKIRVEMAKNSSLLEGIVEADETYIGGNATRIMTKTKMNPVNAVVAQ